MPWILWGAVVNEIVNDTKKHIPKLIWDNITSVSTFILAIGTIVLAVVSCRQVGIMEADQRPWVGADFTGLDQHTDFATSGHFFLDIANSGKSPAFDVTVTLLKWNADINQVQFPIKKCNAGECRIEHLEMLPGLHLGLLIPEIDASPLPKAGDTGFIIARIDYQDSVGTAHVTGICVKIVTAFTANPSRPGNNSIAVTSTSCATPNSNYAS
jgi:hypothetical protein